MSVVHKFVALMDNMLGEHNGTDEQMQWSCPFCSMRIGSDSEKKKLSVNVATGKARCFRCGFTSGGAEYLVKQVSEVTGLSVNAKQFSSLSGGEHFITPRAAVLDVLYPPLATVGDLKPMKLPDEYVPIEKCRDECTTRRAIKYLEQRRGISVDEAKRAHVGYCATGEFAQRLIFPVHMFGGVVYHTNRYCGDSDMKTKNPKKRKGHYAAADVLLGFDAVVGAPVVNIVEGPMDRFAAIDSSVSLLGKRVSDNQIALFNLLVKHGLKELVVTTDPDAEGYKMYQRLLGRVNCKVSQLTMPSGDPFDNRKQFKKLNKQRHVPTIMDMVGQVFSAGKNKEVQWA